jgi:HlyD family secretion protein
MSDRSSLFRRAALENALAPARSLTQAVQIISPLPWASMLAVYLLIAALVLWALLGEIPTYVEGQGVLIVKGGSIYTAVGPSGAGRVTRILVIPGDRVEEGQAVVDLDQEDLRKQVETSEKHLAQLEQARQELTLQAERKTKERRSQLAEQSAILQRMIRTEEQNLANLRELVEIKRSSFAKGIETKEGLVEAMSEVFRSQSAIDAYRDRLAGITVAQSEYDDLWAQRLADLDLKIADATYDLHTLQERLLSSNVVRSPAEGTVIALQTTIGDMVSGGSPVLSVASAGAGMDAVVFVPAEVGKLVKPDMPALISPSTVKREEFGSIKGRVKTVSQFPTTKEAMMAVLQNQQLVDYLSAKGPRVTVRVGLTERADTFTGYLWSSSAGPDQHISPGTLAEARVTVRKQVPISLVIPALKRLTEG